MIKTTNELKLELNNYSNFITKISRLVRDKKLFKIKQGLYETDNKINPFFLSNIIYGPSYISFQTALAYYGIINLVNIGDMFLFSDFTSNKFLFSDE